MPHYSDNKCTRCDEICDRMRLTVKRATFSAMGQPNKIARSRTKDWLCPACVAKDPDYNLPAYGGPGHISPALERVRASGKSLDTRA